MKKSKFNIYYLLATLIVVIYTVLNIISFNNQSKVITHYKEKTNTEALEKEKQISEQFNESLVIGGKFDVRDVFSEDNKAINAFNDDIPLGTIEIPRLGIHLPLYQGTSERELQLGAGVMSGTSFPTGDLNTRSIITAHSGLLTKRMFRDLDKLKAGDIFLVDSYGEKKAYEVYDKNVVLPDNTSSVRIIENKEIVTLLTCVPYMINTHRLLVDGERIEYLEDEDIVVTNDGKKIEVPKKTILDTLKSLSFKDLVDIEYLIIFILILWFIIKRLRLFFIKKRRRKSTE